MSTTDGVNTFEQAIVEESSKAKPRLRRLIEKDGAFVGETKRLFRRTRNGGAADLASL